jgi:hypothetical protein
MRIERCHRRSDEFVISVWLERSHFRMAAFRSSPQSLECTQTPDPPKWITERPDCKAYRIGVPKPAAKKP